MKALAFILMVLGWFPMAAQQSGETPVDIDSANALVLLRYWTAAPAGPADGPVRTLACLYGAVTPDTVVHVDSVVVRDKCGSTAIGAFGAVDKSHYYSDQEIGMIQTRACALLKGKYAGFHVIGVLHGIGLNPLHKRIPLAWGCVKPSEGWSHVDKD